MHPRRMPREFHCGIGDACLEAQERKNNKKDIKMNVTALCPPGFKSHCVGLLLRKENGKCSTAKYCAEFPNIGSHSPKRKRTRNWILYSFVATFYLQKFRLRFIPQE